MALGEIVELPLDIERANSFTVFKIDNPLSGRIAGDVVGTLAELTRVRRSRLGRLKVECERIGLPYSPSASKNLSRRKKGEQRPEHRRRKLRLAFHQIIFVATKCRAGVMINIVLNE